MKPIRTLPISIALLAGLSGCVAAITAPKGYVTLPEPQGYDFKAVSARGAVFAMTAHDNAGGDSADLKFWTAAVEHHKVDLDGYRLNNREEIKTRAGLPGTLFDLRHGSGAGEYTYLIGLFVTPKSVYTIEAGGPTTELSSDLASIREAMRSLNPGNR